MGKPLSRRDVFDRINQGLMKKGLICRIITRGPYRDLYNYEYQIWDQKTESFVRGFDNLEDYAKENGYLKKHEVMSL